jgi:hypothetical protein
MRNRISTRERMMLFLLDQFSRKLQCRPNVIVDKPCFFGEIKHFVLVETFRYPVAPYRGSARFADIADNRFQLIEYDAKILWGEQHALAVDHILDTLLVPAEIRAPRPEPEPCAGQRLGAQVFGKIQIRNAKEVIWEIVSVDQHGTAIIQRHKAATNARGVDRQG